MDDAVAYRQHLGDRRLDDVYELAELRNDVATPWGPFMALNLSVIAYFFVRRGRRSGRDLIFYLLFPLLGFLIIFYVWFNFDAGTFLFGALWLAVGIIIGAVKTKGFRETPAVIEEL